MAIGYCARARAQFILAAERHGVAEDDAFLFSLVIQFSFFPSLGVVRSFKLKNILKRRKKNISNAATLMLENEKKKNNEEVVLYSLHST